uniref:DNA mismatch repair proteins mutS family domain-containing protein n=1 Tax=viral metagenome TaxID=1070528 RepID=A0A6C0EQ10_9ZZZZ
MALIKEYFDLTTKYNRDYGDNIILLMQVGSFFEVYGMKNKNVITGSKILDFSQICELNVVEKNVCIGKENVVMAGFKDIQIEKYIRKIQDAGYTAIVYTQDESVKNTTRSLAGIFSPGTYFSNESSRLTNNITCIWIDLINNTILLKGKFVVVGISNIDIYTGKTSIFQFKESYINNPTTYDELERFISIYSPTEVIIIYNLPEKEVDDVINYANIRCKSIHRFNILLDSELQSQFIKRAKNCEKQSYQKEILNRFYNVNYYDTYIQNFYENNIATQGLCFLLDFVYQHNPHLVNRIAEPVFENCSDRLILANHSLKQLNIIDEDSYGGKYSSVLKMLNECLTPMGKRKFAYKFLNPTTNIGYLQKEYNITEYAINNCEKYNELFRDNLSNIKDISKWKRLILLKKISPKSIHNLYNNILIIQNIHNIVSKDNTIIEYFHSLSNQFENIGEFCEIITQFIDKHIITDIAIQFDQLQNFECNFIKPGVDSVLDSKSELLKNSEEKLESIRNYFSSLLENKEKKTAKNNDFVKIHETEKNNFTLISTNRRCKLLQEMLPTEITQVKLFYTSFLNEKTEFDFKISKSTFKFEKQSASNNSIDDEQIKVLCKNISNIKVTLKDVILSVYNNFLQKFEEYQEKLDYIIEFITAIDLLYCKMTIAQKYNFCKPRIVESDKSFVSAKGLRHCLIEKIQSNELYVTNDITLGNDGVDGILLYGTNAVGKTSFIKAIGISIIMAQAGLYVPSEEFVYKPYNYIFTRILGNDNIFKGLSTFSVEMSELRNILRMADNNSLVLGDELCSGTENVSAISIFVAGIQHLYKSKSSFIFATHLHEIVNYDEITSLESIVLKHMEVVYDLEKEMLIYDRKLKDGPGNNIYGLEVCKSLSLPIEFLNAAYEIRMKYHPTAGSFLSLKTSHYNNNKIISLCEKCGKNMGTDVHHLQHQNEADDDGIIRKQNLTFHKNNLANLLTLCEMCHIEIHKKKTQHKKVKTTKGYIIQEIN